MSKHTLFVCQYCNFSSTQNQCENISNGAQLLNQLLFLHQDWSKKSELKIQAVECLWACDRPCAVALAKANKHTYLFMDLPHQESATALLQLGELYIESKDGFIDYRQFPKVLRGGILAQIPPTLQE